MKTLSEILIDVNSELDLTAELPTDDDLAVRWNFAHQAIDEWASSYQWRQLNQTSAIFVTNASLSLATNFRELTAVPRIGTTEYPAIMQGEALTMNSGDYYTYVMGGVGNYSLAINPVPQDGATLSFTWQRYPSYMATLTSICEVPDASYVKLKIIAKVLRSRLDERFPTVDAEASRVLNNMIGREMPRSPGGSPSARKFGSAAWGLGRRHG